MVKLAIIGCGFGGIAVARELKRRGHEDFTVIESQSALGGVWQSQRYPGCAADMPAFLYSFRDMVPPVGARLVPDRAEILDYLASVVERHGLERHLQFDWPVSTVRKGNDGQPWTITSRNGGEIEAEYVVIATGTTGAPNVPDIPGIDDFDGRVVHTMDWPSDLTIRDRKVAVIGAGASAIQLVPQLARAGAHVTVFSRTNRWILPKPDFPVARLWRATMDRSRSVRAAIGRGLEKYVDRRATDAMFANAEKLASQDRKYRAAMSRHIGEWDGAQPLPQTLFGCTRTLFSNDFFAAFRDHGVNLVPAPGRAVADGLEDEDGVVHECDTIVFATGADRFARSMRIYREDGTELYEEWQAEPKALAGLLPANTPNLFHMSGPNSGVLNAAPRVLEVQARFICDLVETAERDAMTIEAGEDDLEAFLQTLRPLLDRTIWTGAHCDAWYTRKFNQNPVIWPGSLAEYRAMLAGLDRDAVLHPLRQASQARGVGKSSGQAA